MSLATPAAANVFDTYGFGARAASMANAQGAASTDYSATYYNPGALTVNKRPQAGVTVGLMVPALRLERDGAPAPDAPTPVEPDTNVGVTLGLLFPLGGLIQNRFALGVGLYLPTINVTRIEALDGATPHFYRYGALADKLMLTFAGAFELHETISIGVGAQVLGSLDGSASVELDLLTQRFTRRNLSVDVHADTAITAGVLVRPHRDLRLGFSFRDALELRFELVTEIAILDTATLVADISGVSLYTPQQYTWAVAYDASSQVTLALDVVWARWSQAPDPTARFDVTLSGEQLGLGELTANSPDASLGAVDTVSPRLGVEWRPTEEWAVRGGYAYHPTPLPVPSGYTNHLDGDVHQVAVGGGYRFSNPLAGGEAPMSVDLALQMAHMPLRSVHKQVPDDPSGDYAAGGTLWHLGLTLRHEFY